METDYVYNCEPGIYLQWASVNFYFQICSQADWLRLCQTETTFNFSLIRSWSIYVLCSKSDTHTHTQKDIRFLVAVFFVSKKEIEAQPDLNLDLLNVVQLDALQLSHWSSAPMPELQWFIGKSILLAFRRPRFKSWLDLNFFLPHTRQVLTGMCSCPTPMFLVHLKLTSSWPNSTSKGSLISF